MENYKLLNNYEIKTKKFKYILSDDKGEVVHKGKFDNINILEENWILIKHKREQILMNNEGDILKVLPSLSVVEGINPYFVQNRGMGTPFVINQEGKVFFENKSIIKIEKNGNIFLKVTDKGNISIYRVDNQLTEIISNKLDELILESFDDTLYFIGKKGTALGLYNSFGKLLIWGNYSKLVFGGNGCFILMNSKNKFLYNFNKKDQEISEISLVSSYNYYSIYTTQGKYGFLHKTGKLIIPFIFEDYKLYEKSINDYYFLKEKGKWGIYLISCGDFSGRCHCLLEPIIDEMPNEINNLNILKSNGFYGVIDNKFSIIIPFVYDNIIIDNDMNIWVKEKDLIFYYNRLHGTKGNYGVHQILNKEDGYYRVMKDNDIGLMTLNGDALINAKYKDIDITDFNYSRYSSNNGRDNSENLEKIFLARTDDTTDFYLYNGTYFFSVPSSKAIIYHKQFIAQPDEEGISIFYDNKLIYKDVNDMLITIEVLNMSKNRFAIKTKTEDILINETGDILLDNKDYCYLSIEEYFGWQGDDIIIYDKQNDCYGYLLMSGEFISPRFSNFATPYKNGYATIKIEGNRRAYIDSKGDIVLEFTLIGDREVNYWNKDEFFIGEEVISVKEQVMIPQYNYSDEHPSERKPEIVDIVTMRNYYMKLNGEIVHRDSEHYR